MKTAHYKYPAPSRWIESLSHAIRPALIICLLCLTVPLAGQDGTELDERLIDQRISTLRDAGAADADEALKTYEAAKSWLTSATAYAGDTAKYIAALTDAPRLEAEIQQRLDAVGSEPAEIESLQTLSRQQLETELTLTQTTLRDANEALDVLDRRLAARESNANTMRTRLDGIATRLGTMPDQVANVDPTATPSFTEASQWLERTELMALREERRAQSAQLDSQPVRYSALRAERAELKLNIEKLAQRGERFSAQLRSERQTTSESAPLDIASESPVHQFGQQYLAENSLLGEQQMELEARLEAVKAEREVVERAIRLLNERFARARRVVDFATQSDVLGEALLAYWQEIDSLRLYAPRTGIPRQVGDSVISRIGHEEGLTDLVSTSAYLNRDMADAGLDTADISQRERETLLKLLRARRELLRSLIAIESGLIDTLSDLEADYTRHVSIISDYQHYLDPLVLWIPSGARLWKSDFYRIPDELPALMYSVGRIEASPQPAFFICTILALLLLLFRTRLRGFQHRLNSLIFRPRADAIRFTLLALGVAALRTAPAALVVAALASLFSVDKGASAIALNAALNNLVSVLFAVTLLNTLCTKTGVARSHFEWNEIQCDLLQRECRWFIYWLLPGLTLAGFLYRVDSPAALLGRLAMLAVVLWLVTHFARSLWKVVKEGGTEALACHENRIRLLLVLVFSAAVIGVILGLRYSVTVVTLTLMDMLKAGIALAIVHSFFLRWLQVARRHLRFEELVAARQSRTEQPGSELIAVEEDQARLADIGDETRQLLNAATIFVALTILYYLWAPILPVFDAMSDITLWTSTSMMEGETIVYRITLDILVFVILLASITVYAAKKLPALVELVLRSRTGVSAGARYTVSTLLNYLILGTGFLVALSTLGLDWSKLQWLVAALGVGIGFGLQEIVANFISGLIILFERPISVGDVITVGDKDGYVTKIRIRATTIRDWDNKELLIPNREIITGRLLNWSLTDTRLRLSVPVGVAYGSDVNLALKILQETVADDSRILADPEPSIIFKAFGDSSLDLVSRFYIDNVDNLWPVTTQVHLEIYRRFKAAGIVIAFPQRDLHLDSDKPLRVSIDPPPVER